ncbi:hypothetical protein AB0C11_06950 [Streptomyces sp. NPDC039016]
MTDDDNVEVVLIEDADHTATDTAPELAIRRPPGRIAHIYPSPP